MCIFPFSWKGNKLCTKNFWNTQWLSIFVLTFLLAREAKRNSWQKGWVFLQKSALAEVPPARSCWSSSLQILGWQGMAVWLRACLQAGISMHTSSAAFWLSKSWCSAVLQNSRLTPLQCGKWKLTALSLPLKYSWEENVSSQASLSSSSGLLVLVLKYSMERQILIFAIWMENQCCYCLKKSIMEYSWCSVTLCIP